MPAQRNRSSNVFTLNPKTASDRCMTREVSKPVLPPGVSRPKSNPFGSTPIGTNIITNAWRANACADADVPHSHDR
ncbi:hypothetical protein GCM10022207_29980 [Streptomyces lannensis]|uniref:Uncharacterized protein n=1 Tax=Streptomyces lannensis TaxID=766498 RepID=A0ABP7K397_9ACTN